MHLLDNLTRMRNGTFLIPLARTVWDGPYSFGSDSFLEPGFNVHIWSSHLFAANFWISLSTHGACFLKPIRCISMSPSLIAELPFFLLPFLTGAISYGSNWKGTIFTMFYRVLLSDFVFPEVSKACTFGKYLTII